MGRQKNSTAPIDLALFDLELHLSRTGGPGRRDDGGTAPCGRWPWPSACGSRGPCCADASWADRYASFGTPPVLISAGVSPRYHNTGEPPTRSSMLVRHKTQRILYWKKPPPSTVFCDFSPRLGAFSHMVWSKKFYPQTYGFWWKIFLKKGDFPLLSNEFFGIMDQITLIIEMSENRDAFRP